jgi:hypothetical protein
MRQKELHSAQCSGWLSRLHRLDVVPDGEALLFCGLVIFAKQESDLMAMAFVDDTWSSLGFVRG